MVLQEQTWFLALHQDPATGSKYTAARVTSSSCDRPQWRLLPPLLAFCALIGGSGGRPREPSEERSPGPPAPPCLLRIVRAPLGGGSSGAGRHEGCPTPVLACPDDWVGYRNICYYLSKEEGSWKWSQERCSLHGASLAVLQREWEMEFLLRLKGNTDVWLGLRRQGERLEWVDGSSFNQTGVFASCCRILVWGQEPCLFLKDHDLWSSSCHTLGAGGLCHSCT
ncbi:C-type lectin domain family 2 member L-like [Balearica regulorum gibbericeps]|uniref:C-type lectin domain family 2 member L-like n=1 Tax=Balearica regulorum gibbericeps TaxID=100784 RepID=UPI003F5FBCEF